MKDANGLYYHPDPNDMSTRVYVRNSASGIEFRLWRGEHPEIWEKHDWLPYDVIQAAADMYKEKGTNADPMLFYDLNVAKALLKDEARKANMV